MTSAGIIPRNRLKLIPSKQRLPHEYCFFLHDQCVRLLKEYEEAEAHLVRFEFSSDEEQENFLDLARIDTITALLGIGRKEEARRVTINTTTIALVSDCFNHIYEALRCMEKRKIVVSLNLMRKPLLDSLIFLTWILADETSFYESFMSGSPETLTAKKIGNIRAEIISKAIEQTSLKDIVSSEDICDLLFDKNNKFGFYWILQRAVHLVTAMHDAVRTEPGNFNFVFKNPADNDVYEAIYELLPTILLYISHVTLILFDRIKRMDEGAKQAFVTRSTFMYFTLEGNENAVQVKYRLSPFISTLRCERCANDFHASEHNVSRILIGESIRCASCQHVNYLPFSWIF